jgi:soluble epoxide hydrolase/lipid-phosphate phosphatase
LRKNKVRDESKKITKRTDFSFLPAAQLPDHLPTDLPVLHIWGKQGYDSHTKRVVQDERVDTRLDVIELQKVRHWIMVEAKDEVTRAVLDWLTKLVVVIEAMTRRVY